MRWKTWRGMLPARMCWRRGLTGALSNGEGDSPKLQCFLILLNEFNSVSPQAFHRADLRDYTRGHLNALLIFQRDAGAHWQFARELDGSAVPVQISGLGIDRECGLMAVLSR